MAGGLKKFQGKAKAQRHLALPEESEWELWTFSSPTEGRRERTLSIQELGQLPADTRVAVSTRQTVSVPLWLQTEDPSLFAAMIPVQLEKRALLKNPDQPPPLYFHLVHQEAGRSLLFVLLLHPDLPESYRVDSTGDYDFSARCRPLPQDGYTFWKEEGFLSVAITRDGKLTYLQSFPSAHVNDTICRQVVCLHLRLSWEGILTGLSKQVFLQGNFAPEEVYLLQETMQVEAVVFPLGRPLFLDCPGELTPPTVIAARGVRTKKSLWLNRIKQVGMVYAVIILLLLGRFAWTSFQVYTLNQEIAAIHPDVERLQQISDHWKAMQPAIDPRYYPLETLLACVKNFPPDARLTEFNQSAGKALMVGESSDAANAFKFLNGMQSDASVKKWTWTMPQPILLPSNRARFQLEGTHEGAIVK